MKADIYEYDGVGIQCVYKNKEWLVCIKNWKPDNDIDGIHRLEVHLETDEQFIPVHGRTILLVADRKDDKFSIDLIEMEIGKVFNVPKNTWFYTIVEKDAKLAYVQHADTSVDNSEYCELSESELADVQSRARKIWNR
ncbi:MULTISPECIES: hypothetical protein [unclassified Paenibacillus]|uniref:hypothetical protein n=1 Tax=unclassified Paenibacillus TaxID=185978 RepID=UPI002406A1FF|nr:MULTISPECIES: hypothetical protein [unclassified Paenibacillus]MDF9839486.1 ureidoglycolate hydrolase [Paenibacillus sp. PastF-2]MDF9846067.1 ureidoglycolate hydrolase [Paenibacillus sp. PastM-2]MDF9852640.1 ureidoglycolate hydrolase [Paenibacillus sp. PastF-1]MDH6477629.1 ureidoglycolate hydrolase [Paenibacillus sp. PastH-2]MDH6505372.1 ureidoglycolate hydrolase [Paenibacillus sp. PastM-3]